jgi:hypothetical protein
MNSQLRVRINSQIRKRNAERLRKYIKFRRHDDESR